MFSLIYHDYFYLVFNPVFLDSQTIILIITAGSIGFFHTLLGPDHFIPFIILSKDRAWTMNKTLWITFLCGIGHVGSSVLLGLLGITLGWSLSSLEWFEGLRGEVAGWLLIGFGILYILWGIRKVLKNKPHSHWHRHENGSVHLHGHTHVQEHSHIHEGKKPSSLTPWVLFIIFVFGPCEPLIPVLMYPAASGNIAGLIAVVLVFSLATILTMLAIVWVTAYGLKSIHFGKIEQYSPVLSGAIILLSGIAVQFFGL